MQVGPWIIGSLAFAAMEGSYLPQIVRLFRRKRAEDVSWLFPALNLAGRITAASYALTRGQDGFAIGFFVGAALRATLLFQILFYRANGERDRERRDESQDDVRVELRELPAAGPDR